MSPSPQKLDDATVFDLLDSLVSKSLVVADPGGGDYRLLERTSEAALSRKERDWPDQRLQAGHSTENDDRPAGTSSVSEELTIKAQSPPGSVTGTDPAGVESAQMSSPPRS